MIYISYFMAFVLSLPLAIGDPSIATNISAHNLQTSLTILYQNNLNTTDDINHVGVILLDPMNLAEASIACESINESLLSRSMLEAHHNEILLSLSYITYTGRAEPFQLYRIGDGMLAATIGYGNLTFQPSTSGLLRYPTLCTQSSNQNQPGDAIATPANEISLASRGNTYIGFRNQKSFRFLGIPYADTPQRFVYSNLYSQQGVVIQATAYGADCLQAGGGSEDCLFLNIQTPYIPKAGSTQNLRPVMFWIHGGKYASGSGADPLTDGGNLASREDIVLVTINYRLSTLGFFAVPGTNIRGNYGISDQITALQVGSLEHTWSVLMEVVDHR